MIGKDKIYVYDAFTNLYKDDEFHLFPNELYLYCFLYRNRSHDYKVRMNVETVHQSMPIKFHPSKETKNRNEIKRNLLSLRNKGIINFHVDDKLFIIKSGNYASLEITFNRFTENKGHTQVAYSDFDSAENIKYFYITMAVGRYNNVKIYSGYGGRWISVNEFGKLLGVSGRTFKNYADDMISKGLLYKASGKKKENSNEQDKNTYKTVPYGFENKKVTTEIIQVESDQKETEVAESEIVTVDSSGEIEWGNWKISKNKITYDDCLLYWKQRVNKEFAVVCDKRLARIPENAMHFIQKNLDLAEDKINEQKFREQAAINVKIRNDKINLIKSCKGIPIVSDNDGVTDLSVDDIDNLKLNDEIYLLNETEQWEQGYRMGTKIEIEKCSIKSLINGEVGLQDVSEFVKFNETNVEVLFAKFKTIICNKGLFVRKDLQALSEFRENLILEESVGMDIEDDWEGDIYACYGPTDVTNLSKEKRRYKSVRKHEGLNPVAAAQRKMMNEFKNKYSDISEFLDEEVKVEKPDPFDNGYWEDEPEDNCVTILKDIEPTR
jgi:hypothetical protein